MATGTIKTWKGNFGFIVEEGGGDIYFNLKTNPDLEDWKNSLVDEKVVFEKRQSTRFPDAPNKFEAYNVRLQGTPSQQSKQSTGNRQQSASPSQGTEQSKPPPGETFHNPYTFVPTPPRPSNGFAGDFNPLECGLDHASLNPQLWTGHIPIKLTTITPLVLPDAGGEKRSSKEHQKYDVFDRLLESSLRGMLRSAYEVVTNSRYGHLSYRVGKDKKKYEKSPKELLHTSLWPADSINKLSPADRLFGWVPSSEQDEQSKGGYKSRIRVVCEDGERPDIIQYFEEDQHLPLAILAEPKPQQARFYVAKDKYGKPQCDGLSKEDAGYSGEEKGLRGRKQYWHHKGLEAKKAAAYWKPSVEDRTQKKKDDRYQEYRRPNDNPGTKDSKPQTDSQNRSIRGWIRPGTEFKATLYVQNLQDKEVGALLWLLTLNDKINASGEKYYFRLGYGKPLGFGSVKMGIDTDRVDCCLPLGTGKNWKEDYYAVLDNSPPATLAQKMQEEYMKEFKDSMRDSYSCPENYEADTERNFENLLFISGFLQALRGPKTDLPIHYPRLSENPDPKGENFNWFKRNDQGKKLALPAVTDKKSLPHDPKRREP